MSAGPASRKKGRTCPGGEETCERFAEKKNGEKKRGAQARLVTRAEEKEGDRACRITKEHLQCKGIGQPCGRDRSEVPIKRPEEARRGTFCERGSPNPFLRKEGAPASSSKKNLSFLDGRRNGEKGAFYLQKKKPALNEGGERFFLSQEVPNCQKKEPITDERRKNPRSHNRRDFYGGKDGLLGV